MLFFKKAQISHFLIGVVILVLINFLWLKSTVLGLILAIFWLFGLISAVFSNKLIDKEINLIQKTVGLIFSISLIIVISSLFFYILKLNNFYIIVIFILINILAWLIINKKNITPKINLEFIKIKKNKINLLIYLVLFVAALVILLISQSESALVSPWEVVPKSFLVIYFFMSAILIKFLARGKNEENLTLKLILISSHYFLTLSVAWLVYKIGFGFDPFIHRAAELKLAELGYILPKPFYYIGQYSLVVWLSKIFILPLNLIDKILVPSLVSLTLPTISYYSLKEKIINKKILLVAVISLLVVVTPIFFYTVPQSLANLLLIILILLSFKNLINQEKIKIWYGIILLAIFFIHALTGVAGLIYMVTILFFDKKYFRKINKLKNNIIIKIIIFIGLSVLLPFFFILSNFLNSFSLKFSFDNLKYLGEILNNSFNYLPFYSVYHLIYLYEYNWLLLLVIIILIGGYYFIKKKNYKLLKNQGKILLLLLSNLILLSLIKFNLVINYEQGEFIKRFGQIIVLTLIPFIVTGIYFISYKIAKLKAGKYILAISLAGVLTIGIYLSYPHNDAFTKARGFSVSKNDIKAVQWINQNANNNDFIVLANQSVAAASLQEFGFKKYYHNLFYYPIPTSSPLYDIYLKMVYEKPNLNLIQQATKLTGVKQIYFVINNYWLDNKKIIQQAGELTSVQKNINNKVWIFRFDIEK